MTKKSACLERDNANAPSCSLPLLKVYACSGVTSNRAILPLARSFVATLATGEVLCRWSTAWPTTPGRNIVSKPRSRPRFTNYAIVEPASSCKQESQSRRCASSWATAISKVRCSMQKWIRPRSSTICSATNNGKGGSGNHGEGTPSPHLGGQQRGGPSPVYLDAG